MTIEKSHGKARPTMPRASDARAASADVKPSDTRGPHGHFAAGNRSGVAARFTHTVKKALGDSDSKGENLIVARDARRIFGHVLRSLPSDAPPVRVLLAIHARHVALNAYFTAKAEAAGLDTPGGLELLGIADRQSQRAERTLISAQDMARVCADQAAKATIHADPLARWSALPPKGSE